MRIVSSGSSNTTGSLQFRLNNSQHAASAIATNAISMSTDYINNVMSDNVFNILLQRNYATSSNTVPASHFTQSYHMYIGRKDDDKTIRNKWIKLNKEHHPDNLIAKGMPKDFINRSNEQLASINLAYDKIKEIRENI